eukprot:SAG31_NODE_878_length_11297_cov_3.770714_10_plen_277_part_00
MRGAGFTAAQVDLIVTAATTLGPTAGEPVASAPAVDVAKSTTPVAARLAAARDAAAAADAVVAAAAAALSNAEADADAASANYAAAIERRRRAAEIAAASAADNAVRQIRQVADNDATAEDHVVESMGELDCKRQHKIEEAEVAKHPRQQLLQLVADGVACVTDLLRLAESVPPVFFLRTQAERNRYGRLLPDFLGIPNSTSSSSENSTPTAVALVEDQWLVTVCQLQQRIASDIELAALDAVSQHEELLHMLKCIPIRRLRLRRSSIILFSCVHR